MPAQNLEQLEKAGRAALDEYLATFNSGDPSAWANSLHYPHIRLSGDKVLVWDTPEEYARDNDTGKLKEASGWGYSVWDWCKMVQADDTKMHFAVQFTRYTPDHKKMVSYESFYVLTYANGRWGTLCRSSYAGILTPTTAF